MEKTIFQFSVITILFSVCLLSACGEDDEFVPNDDTIEEHLIDTMQTADGVQFVRTPEEQF
ncbi:MAG: hypothetical protein AAFY76_13725, partial [Cyanobacteria bacterium J06649_11]